MEVEVCFCWDLLCKICDYTAFCALTCRKFRGPPASRIFLKIKKKKPKLFIFKNSSSSTFNLQMRKASLAGELNFIEVADLMCFLPVSLNHTIFYLQRDYSQPTVNTEHSHTTSFATQSRRTSNTAFISKAFWNSAFSVTVTDEGNSYQNEQQKVPSEPTLFYYFLMQHMWNINKPYKYFTQ